MTSEELYKKGLHYYYGNYWWRGNIQKAFDFFLAAFEAEPDSEKLCDKLLQKYDVLNKLKDKDKDKAIYLNTKMAEYGYISAQFELGLFYYYKGDKDSMDKAVYWLNKAAEQGYKNAQIFLVYCYELRSCSEQAYNTAKKWFDEIAFRDPNSLRWYVFSQYESDYNYELALEWYVRSAECGVELTHDDRHIKHLVENKGKAILNFHLAECYAIDDDEYGLKICRNDNGGYYVETPDSDSSRLEEGVKLGNPIAQYNKGICYMFDLRSSYYRNNEGGIGSWGDVFYDDYQEYMEEQYSCGVPLIEKAAEQGLAIAQYELGNCYYYGKKFPVDIQKALEYYTMAAEQGCAAAQYNLGRCYYMGVGVEKSLDKAREWFSLSAMNGFANAQYNLAALYYNSDSEPALAFEWFSKAAAQDVAQAQYFVGKCYFNGYGTEKSYEKAVEYYTKAATKDIANAQFQLGMCYQNGYGVEQSDDMAIKWLSDAGFKGVSEAQYIVGKYYLANNNLENAEYHLKRAKNNLHQDAKKLYEENEALFIKLKKQKNRFINTEKGRGVLLLIFCLIIELTFIIIGIIIHS